jgi:hypothetical protein
VSLRWIFIVCGAAACATPVESASFRPTGPAATDQESRTGALEAVYESPLGRVHLWSNGAAPAGDGRVLLHVGIRVDVGNAVVDPSALKIEGVPARLVAARGGPRHIDAQFLLPRGTSPHALDGFVVAWAVVRPDAPSDRFARRTSFTDDVRPASQVVRSRVDKHYY